MAMPSVHRHTASLRSARQAESRLEFVQQAAVIGVACVLNVELPVPEHALPLITEYPYAFGKQAVEVLDNPRTQIVLKRLLGPLGASKDDASIDRDVQALKSVMRDIE